MNKFYLDSDSESLKPFKPRDSEYRSPFQIDRDRIIHTSAFRRLQSKTQVFFSGEYDFYRTRLTHSLEVAQIGRSICSRLMKCSDELSDDFFVDSDLVEASCLAHDIGHPPFGHTGERVLNQLMKPYGGFEGNAQTLRLLTETIFGSNRGMNPTRAFLDGVLKYKTLYDELDSPDNHFLYSSQKEYLDFVLHGESFPAEAVPGKKRDKIRSIECQIMDWADDTAYSLNDLSDGIEAGFITIEKIEQWAGNNELSQIGNQAIEFLLEAIRQQKVEPKLGMKIGDFIEASSLKKVDGFGSERTNRYKFELTVDDNIREESEMFKMLSVDLVFRTPQLQQLDYKSGHILKKLWEVFNERYVTSTSKKGFNLVSANLEKQLLGEEKEEVRARLICDYLASMTDGFALRTYRRLFDPEFGSINDLI